ncbi:MAG TPA: CocE/NonD family hydrolase, partial [Acidimicrobiales bacterium]|nr:CocE/NonD family hydrolase [Acidimicrobiales bacterium]
MKNRRRFALLGAGACAALLVTPVVRAATPAYTTELLHFAVHVGPAVSPETCDVVGELFTPTSASPANPVPAILTTNGFGGSYTDQIGLAEFGADHGYSVLTYSGLGFGGSGCKITLDDPTWDGEAASQLISFLGGAPGIAFRDAGHTQPAPVLGGVLLDNPGTHDPRVGMIGGSYGGEIQFATADVDRRLDTIIPFITWNSLNYSLAPNNAGLT